MDGGDREIHFLSVARSSSFTFRGSFFSSFWDFSKSDVNNFELFYMALTPKRQKLLLISLNLTNLNSAKWRMRQFCHLPVVTDGSTCTSLLVAHAFSRHLMGGEALETRSKTDDVFCWNHVQWNAYRLSRDHSKVGRCVVYL